MKTFKRNMFGLLKGLAISVFGSAALAALVYMFTAKLVLCVIIGVALMAILLFITIFKDDIKIELEDGALRYFQRGALKQTVMLDEHMARYHIRESDGSADSINLYFAPKAGGDELCLDCEPLGSRQFYALWAALEEACAVAPPERLETQKHE